MLVTLLAFNWTFQLFFGRYRDWGGLGIEHFAITILTISLMLMIYISCLKSRLNKYEGETSAIPHTSLPLTKDDMSRKMFKAVLNQMMRVTAIQDGTILIADPENGDPGWGRDDSKVAGVHFKTSVAKSYYVLEEAALSRRPNLRHRHSRTIREYVRKLESEFPSLRKKLCDEYIATYERARYGSEKIVYADYERFMQVVMEMVGIMTERTR